MSPRPDTDFAPFPIAGVDEVGRGPLAGPVVAAAVVLDPRRPIDGLDDSKRLGAAERERLDVLIRRRAASWCVASASVTEIDELNILHASLLAMRRAVAGLTRPPAPTGPPTDERAVNAAVAAGFVAGPDGPGRADGPEDPADPPDPTGARPGAAPALVLVDGNRCPDRLPYPCCAVIEGDGRVRSIAAASIVAKVARDALMRAWDERLPGFGFARHKGYATREHREALLRHGVAPLHRRSFAPVRLALAGTNNASPTSHRSRTRA